MDDVWPGNGDFVGRPVSLRFPSAQPVVQARPIPAQPARPAATSLTAIRINPDGSAMLVQFETSDRLIAGLELLGFLVIAGVLVYASLP